MAATRRNPSQNGSKTNSPPKGGKKTALAVLISLGVPFTLVALQYVFDIDTPGLFREWSVIEETGQRVRNLPDKERHSKARVVASWERIEGEVRAVREGETNFDSEKQGMWVDW